MLSEMTTTDKIMLTLFILSFTTLTLMIILLKLKISKSRIDTNIRGKVLEKWILNNLKKHTSKKQ